ncbi:MAG: response regulator transcription factor [Candidatus Pelagibacterales bacterium]|nr:MAG: response regulator transcription factor [Pelagibacterales bacterium]
MDKDIAHILVVDDDDRIRNLIKEYLLNKNYIVTTAKDAFDAKKKIDLIKFDLIILDIMMPKKSGLELTDELKKDNKFPIILLTAKGETDERVEGLERGADDYLSKPFEPKELLLRIKNILNKTLKKKQKEKLKIGPSILDLNKLIIEKKDKSYKINNTEKLILEKMINSPGQIFTRDEIGKLINIDKERSIDVIITRLRKKIEINSKKPQYLQTIRGTGYVLWIE